MDPVTQAAQAFIEEGRTLFDREGCPAIRLVCENGHRRELFKALRLWECAPNNRRPFLVYDQPYRLGDRYFDDLSKNIRDDYERLRKGAAEEGVELPTFELQGGDRSIDALSSLERAVVTAERAAALLGKRMDGIVLVLAPYHVEDAGSWRESVFQLLAAPWSSRVRLGFFDPPGGPLDQVLGDRAARFSVDTDLLFDYLKQVVNGKSNGPAGPERPGATEAQRKEYEERTGQKLLPEDEARALRGLVVDAGHHMAKGRYAEAGEAFDTARRFCQRFGLRLEEATVLVGMAGLAMQTQALDQALEWYRQAAEIAEEKGQWQLVAQVRLAMGTALVMQQQYRSAIDTYEAAAEAAQRASVSMLRIEALRMQGTCHVLRGARDEAIFPWQRALTEGSALDPGTRQATTFRDVAKQFSALLERNGMRPQAEHVRAMADMPGEA